MKVADIVAAVDLAHLLIAHLLAHFLRRATDNVVLAEHLNLLLILRFVTFLQCFRCLDGKC